MAYQRRKVPTQLAPGDRLFTRKRRLALALLVLGACAGGPDKKQNLTAPASEAEDAGRPPVLEIPDSGAPVSTAPLQVQVVRKDGMRPATGALVSWRQGTSGSTSLSVDAEGMVRLDGYDPAGPACDFTAYLDDYTTYSVVALPSPTFARLVAAPLALSPLRPAAQPQIKVSGSHARPDPGRGILVIASSAGSVALHKTDDWSVQVGAETPFTLLAYDAIPGDDGVTLSDLHWYRLDHEGSAKDISHMSFGAALAEERFEVSFPSELPVGHPFAMLENVKARPFVFSLGPAQQWLLQLNALLNVPDQAVEGVYTFSLSRPANLEGLGAPFILFEVTAPDSEAFAMVSTPGLDAADPSRLQLPAPVEARQKEAGVFTWQEHAVNAGMVVEMTVKDDPDGPPLWTLVTLQAGGIHLPVLPDGVSLAKMTATGSPSATITLCGAVKDVPIGCGRLAISEPFSL